MNELLERFDGSREAAGVHKERVRELGRLELLRGEATVLILSSSSL